ncbi:hypothetical protein DFJ74DRAFT_141127 [Hyaloraphidium curvatum]|nr:hypothetical protein DFJ74DRAFT_141127 [Hyaloraphidium curvatum]
MLAAAIAGPFVGNAQCVPSRDMQMKVLDAVRFCIRELRCDGNEPTGNPLFVVNPNMDIKNPESIFFDGQCPAVSVDTEIVRPLHILSQITGPRAICYAVALEIGQCLVEGGADPDGVNNTGHTPLIAALFEEVTRPDFKGNESNRPHYIGIVGLVRMLLTLGAKPNLPSTSPSSLISPLSVAVMLSGDEQAVAVGRLLLEGGADFTPVSYPYTREGPDGEDILLAFDYLKVAVKMGRVAFVKFALTEAKLDADIQLPSFYFVPLLIYAVMEGFVPMVRMLLENGATVSKETWGCASGMLKDARKGHHVPHGFSDSELARRRALGSRVLPTVEERGRSFGSWSKRWTGARCFEAFAFGRGRDRDRWK